MAEPLFVVTGAEKVEAYFTYLAVALPKVVSAAEEHQAQVEAQRAAQRARSLGSTAAHVAPALKATGGSVVVDGSGSYPMALGAEAGSYRFHQFKPYLGPEGGYFLAPTLQADQEAIKDGLAHAVEALINL